MRTKSTTHGGDCAPPSKAKINRPLIQPMEGGAPSPPPGRTRLLQLVRPRQTAGSEVYRHFDWFANNWCAAGGRFVWSPCGSTALRRTAAALARLGLLRNLSGAGSTACLVPTAWCSESPFFPFCYNHEIVPVHWDCWQSRFSRCERALRRQRTRVAVFTARDAARHFGARFPELQALWMPEAIEAGEYAHQTPLSRRGLHVLELGRRFGRYHDRITAALGQAGLVHKYETPPGNIIFPARRALLAGLADTVVMICFSQSITHAEIAGPVDTLTQRYWEGMAAGCVLVGHAPAELVDLLGYAPVIPVDWNDPAGQLGDIVRHPDRWQALVERNRQAVLERGLWSVRVRELAGQLHALGYDTGIDLCEAKQSGTQETRKPTGPIS